MKYINKLCKLCNMYKPISEFHVASRNKDGHENRCRVCKITRARGLRQDNPEKYRKKNRQRFFKRRGITENDYDVLLKSQAGKCAICRSSKIKRKTSFHFHIDHDHETGTVRGLLCHPCNIKLGWFEKYDIQRYLQSNPIRRITYEAR